MKVKAHGFRKTLDSDGVTVSELLVTRPTVIRVIEQGEHVLIEGQTITPAEDESVEFWRQKAESRRGLEAIIPHTQIDVEEIDREVEAANNRLRELRRGR